MHSGKGAGMPFTDLRAFPRVQYPSHLRPYLLMGGTICEVVDCSELGVRFGGVLEMPVLGDEICADLCFRSGVVVPVCGIVVRIQNEEVALALHPGRGVPGVVIRDEEAALHE